MVITEFNSKIETVDIINAALSYIDQSPISSLESPSETATLMKLHLKLAIRTLLSNYTWSFALTRRQLSHLDDAEKENSVTSDDGNTTTSLYPEYKYCYSFPDNLITVANVLKMNGVPFTNNTYQDINIYGSGTITRPEYIPRGNNIWCNESDIILEYVQYIENINVYSQLFLDCLIYELAFRGAKILTNSASYEQLMKNYSEEALRKAIRDDVLRNQTPVFI
jgi:hypothetical protein